MAQSMQVHEFPYIDRYKTIPGLENRSRSDVFLQNQEEVREITVLTHFLL